MERKEYFELAAREIKNLGFRVFVNINKPGEYSYFYGYFSDGKNIGYFQLHEFGGICWNTVNKPGSFCSGFSCNDDGVLIQNITAERLREAFVTVPNWYRLSNYEISRGGVKKYANLEEFLNNSFYGEPNRDRLKEI